MSSPMSRAQQSVEILFPKRHIIFCEDLMECYPGESNQLLLSRLKRVKKYLDSLNGTIFIMSHGVFISHLTIYLIFAQLNYRNNNYLLRPIRNMHYAKLTRKGGLYSLSDYNKTFK